ncbi:olfactory receptor 4C13-like [Dama dama]|uniref:olfactory receptor 4C13-like n=1 Tax=Dama dama TaxID=30532 RepID=UPI002A359ED6|nr:olfactory receptor 4C13-like [Dama dama]
MYFFLIHLSFIDGIFSSVTTPKMIIDLLYQRRTISWGGCLTQLFLEHFLAASEVTVLISMAYDRYKAICKPLHYTTIVRQGLSKLLVAVAWIRGILHATMQMLFTVDLTFCGPNIINHFMSDFFSLLEIACSNTYRLGMVEATNSGDVSLTSVTTSKLITDLLYQKRIISWGGCLTQISLEHFLGGSDIVIIIIMAYDRYVTICKPLPLHDHYATGALDIDHLVCDFFSLLKLAYRLGTLVAANNGAMCKLIFSMLLISYRVILGSLKSYGSEE